MGITENSFFLEVSLHAVPELTEEIIHPGALETKSQLTEDLGEMKSQLSKQVARVRELRVKKVEQPGMESSFEIGFSYQTKRELTAERHMRACFSDVFYGNDDVDLHNVDVMTDVSMAPTAFTRYTAAPSTASKKSR
jgi:elongator complex protein 1